MNEQTRNVLNDIIELANRLQTHQFEKAVKEIGLNVEIQKKPEGDHIVHFSFPDDTVIDSTLYIFRLFNQQSESVSFPSLNRLLSDMGLSDDFRSSITKLRDDYFVFLSMYPSGVESGFFEEGSHPNNNEILRVVINGGFGHRNDPNKRKKYKTWTRDEIREGVLMQIFSRIVFVIIVLIRQLQLLCQSEIANKTTSAALTKST